MRAVLRRLDPDPRSPNPGCQYFGRLTQNNVTKALARETLSFVTSIENTYNKILTEYILYTLFIKITKFKQKTSRAV